MALSATYFYMLREPSIEVTFICILHLSLRIFRQRIIYHLKIYSFFEMQVKDVFHSISNVLSSLVFIFNKGQRWCL